MRMFFEESIEETNASGIDLLHVTEACKSVGHFMRKLHLTQEQRPSCKSG
jgi:hypothetical protein